MVEVGASVGTLLVPLAVAVAYPEYVAMYPTGCTCDDFFSERSFEKKSKDHLHNRKCPP